MSPSIHGLIGQGFKAHQAGRLDEARACYEQVLQAVPGHPEACQLMGLLARRFGDDVLAESLFRRSLAAEPAQAHVWNNLGNVLLASSRAEEARQAFRQAIAIKLDYAEAHYNLARACLRDARPQEAAECLDRAWQLSASPTLPMWQLKAQIEVECGQLGTSERTLRSALVRFPEAAALWHNLAVTLQRAHRHDEALGAHQQAMALGLDSADAHYNRGNTLQSVGRIDEALAAYRQAVQRNPLHPLALHDLTRLRWRLDHADFDTEIRYAIALAPQQATAAGVLGQLLQQAGRFDEALPCFQEAARREPDRAHWHDGMGACQVRLGLVAQGLATQRLAASMAPADPEVLCNLSTSLMIAGRVDEALLVASEACARAPFHQRAQALRDLAHRVLRQPDSDGQALASEIQQIRLRPPAGWNDIHAFNQALAAELRRLHADDRRQPIDQSLRGGTQTFGNLFASSLPLITALRQAITEAVTQAIAAMPDADAVSLQHPYFGRRPGYAGRWRFDAAWSSRLSQGGFHNDHVHPHGWMSSVYYVQLPPGVEDPLRRQGWLRFGVPDFSIPGVPLDRLVQRMVQPAEGLLVLFPSMCWHGTIPFADAAERLTVAFDVLPT